MSIENTWNNINDDKDDDLSSLLQQKRLSKLSSHNPLQKIKRNLLISMIWGIAICAAYVMIIFYFRIWQVQVSMGLVLLFSVWALYTSYQQYKKIDTAVSSVNPVLLELKRNHQSLTTWSKTQQHVALLIYPISATGGFMLGGVAGSGKSVEDFMGNPFILVALLITLAILVPACYYLAKWMFNYSFGKHLNILQKNIQELEEEK
jgi:hypothetical protein